ncbi:MAG: hypothetical protein ABF904_04445 [Ethanoligenens sp.]
MGNAKKSICASNNSSGVTGRNPLEKSSTYKIDGKAFIVEPVFRQDGSETLGTILVKLMKADASQP